MTNIVISGRVTDLQTDDLDKKLILAIQYVCNGDGIRVPWEKVGAVMGEGITDGAVIQHMAKLRQRMVALDLSVPPPLKRGGGYALPIPGANLGSSRSTLSKNTRVVTGAQSSSSAAAGKKKAENYGADETSDSEVAFGKTRSKRFKQGSKDKTRSSEAKTYESEEDEEPVSSRVGEKRKHQRGETRSPPSKSQKKEETKTSESAIRARRSTAKYDDFKESASGEYEESHIVDAEHDVIERDFVAARATFLRSETPDDDAPSKVVVLQLGNSERSRKMLEELDYTSGNETDFDSESEEEYEMQEEISEDVSNVNVATTSSPQVVNEQPEYEAFGFDQPSRDDFHPSVNNFGNAMGLPDSPQAAAYPMLRHTAYPPINLLNSASTISNGVSLYADNSTIADVQGEIYRFPNESFNDQILTGSGNLPSSGMHGNVYDFACQTPGGQDFGHNWINPVRDHSALNSHQISSHHGVHRFSTAEYDSARASSSLYVPTRNGSGYNTPNPFNQIGDPNGGQHIGGPSQHANFGDSSILHSGMACDMVANRHNRDMLNQIVGAHYQSYSVDRDVNREQLFPATQQQRLSQSVHGAAQYANGRSTSNEPSLTLNATTGYYDPSPLDNTSVAGFDSSQSHSPGQVQVDTHDGLGNGDEYVMMDDAFDFDSFDADFGHEENTFA